MYIYLAPPDSLLLSLYQYENQDMKINMRISAHILIKIIVDM